MEDGTDQYTEHANRIATGDQAALTLLLTEMRPQLRSTLAKRMPIWLQRLVDPDDIIQIAYVDVFRRIGTSAGPRTPDTFPRWITAVALNRLRDAIREETAAKRGGHNGPAIQRAIEDSTIMLLDRIAGPGHTPSWSVARQEIVKAVHEAVQVLPTRYRQVIWIVYIQGGSAKQAAEAMRKSERAIHGLCRRGLKLLESELRQRTGLLSSTC